MQGQFRSTPGIDTRYGEANVIPITVPVFGLAFERPGDFAFLLLVNGNELARYPIHVVAIPAAS